MMRVIVPLLLLSTIACGGQTAEPAAQQNAPSAAQSAGAPTLTPEQLGELGAQIHKEPARADELLSQRGLTQESFEKAIRDVTESPEASRRYAASYKRAGA